MLTPPVERRCAAGRVPETCCVGFPWKPVDIYDIMVNGEPLPPEVIMTAAATGIEPHALDRHVTAVHGWEPHDIGYAEAVRGAADCLACGGCP